jgi:hypothetical protein
VSGEGGKVDMDIQVLKENPHITQIPVFEG